MNKNIKNGLSGFITFVGLVGAIVTIISDRHGLLIVGFLLLGGAGAALLAMTNSFWRERKTNKGLPQLEKLEEIWSGYSVLPATRQDIDWIADLEAQVYSSEDAVPANVLKEWYASNPTGFYVIRTGIGGKIGHIDLLPLREATLRVFMDGQIKERDIRGDSLYSSSERNLIRDLYVESIIVLPPRGRSNAPAVLAVLSNIDSIVEGMCDPSAVENVYAIAASKAGERLMLRLGFEHARLAGSRLDHHDLLQVKFKTLSANIARLLNGKS